MTPLTVLMTAYNRERYIAASIESVLAQTFADFTLLIVDDHSTDGTAATAERYAARDRRVRVVRNDRNLGDYPNRNRAAALVETEFFKFHDSDDVMYPHALETMIRPLAAEPAAGLAASGHTAWAGGPCPMLLSPSQCYSREFLGAGLFMLGPAGMMFRSAAFRAVGGFEPAGPASDLIFWLKACRTLSVLLVPGDLYWYRVHAGQESATPEAAAGVAIAARRVWDALAHPDCPLTGAELAQARRHAAFVNARRAWRLARHGDFGAAVRHARDCGLGPADWARYLRRPQRVHTAGTPAIVTGCFSLERWGRGPLPGPDRR